METTLSISMGYVSLSMQIYHGAALSRTV